MIDITAHIRELLFRHDCVILPSFGGFIGNYRPARIDRETNTFTPPVKAISFNRNLTHNDGLLIGKISEVRKIGYADSKRIVEDFTARVMQRLEDGERVAFERIGYFQVNNEGSIEFEPDRDENFLLDSYGFTSFKREPLLVASQGGRLSRDMDPLRSSNRKMAWRAVIAAPIIAAMILVPLKTSLFSSRASLNPVSGLELSDSELVAKVRADKVAEPEKQETVEASEVVESPVSTVSFHIVAGSFRNHLNASKMLEEAKNKGYAASLSESEKGYYRVLLDSSASREGAIKLRDKLSADYSDCWILTR